MDARYISTAEIRAAVSRSGAQVMQEDSPQEIEQSGCEGVRHPCFPIEYPEWERVFDRLNGNLEVSLSVSGENVYLNGDRPVEGLPAFNYWILDGLRKNGFMQNFSVIGGLILEPVPLDLDGPYFGGDVYYGVDFPSNGSGNPQHGVVLNILDQIENGGYPFSVPGFQNGELLFKFTDDEGSKISVTYDKGSNPDLPWVITVDGLVYYSNKPHPVLLRMADGSDARAIQVLISTYLSVTSEEPLSDSGANSGFTLATLLVPGIESTSTFVPNGSIVTVGEGTAFGMNTMNTVSGDWSSLVRKQSLREALEVMQGEKLFLRVTTPDTCVSEFNAEDPGVVNTNLFTTQTFLPLVSHNSTSGDVEGAVATKLEKKRYARYLKLLQEQLATIVERAQAEKRSLTSEEILRLKEIDTALYGTSLNRDPKTGQRVCNYDSLGSDIHRRFLGRSDFNLEDYLDSLVAGRYITNGEADTLWALYGSVYGNDLAMSSA